METHKQLLPQSPLFLDYLATTPVDTIVLNELLKYMQEDFGNPQSGHFFGDKPKQAISTARKQLADLIGCTCASNIIFTSGASESNALAIVGGLKSIKQKNEVRDHIITSRIEHSAVINTINALEGYRVTILDVDNTGMISLDDLKNAIEPERTAMVSIMLANNEVGTIQPLSKISKICHQYGIIVHSDAAQVVGKFPVDVKKLGIDLLSIAGHKFYGPKGIGALYCRGDFRPLAIIHGTNQEAGIRSGTLNVSGIVGIGKAAELARQELESGYHKHIQMMRDDLEVRLKEAFPSAVVNGHPVERLPLLLSIGFPGVVGYQLMQNLREKLCFSAGEAANTGTGSRTLSAMKVPEEISKGTIRLSLGRFTTPDHINSAIDLLTVAITQMLTEKEF